MYNKATKYLSGGKPEKAIQFYKKALAQNNFKEAWLNLGTAYRMIDNDLDAYKCYQKANDPEIPNIDGKYMSQYAFALNNLGLTAYTYGRDREAEEYYKKALDIDPMYYDAIWNYSNVLLRDCSSGIGDWDYAWRLYEYRFKRNSPVVLKSKKLLKPWKPGIKGSVCVLVEQGLGDQLMFGRYISKLALLVDKVYVQCDPMLDAVFSDYTTCRDPIDTDAEYGISICSLAQHFDISGGDWLKGKYDKLKLGNGTGTDFKIGIVWSGSPTHANDRNRSVTEHRFHRLSKFGNLYSLDPKFNGSKHIKKLELKNWGDTARAINAMDLVICIDSSVSHMCGCLDKECWVLMPLKETDFRWGRSEMGEANVWYDSVKVIRNNNSWEDVFDRVEAKLAQRLVELEEVQLMGAMLND